MHFLTQIASASRQCLGAVRCQGSRLGDGEASLASRNGRDAAAGKFQCQSPLRPLLGAVPSRGFLLGSGALWTGTQTLRIFLLGNPGFRTG